MMMRLGRMSEAGLVSVEELMRRGTWGEAYTSKVGPIISKDLAEALGSNSPAMDNFMRLSNSTKLQLIVWIESAKRSETRTKRTQECIRRV